MDDGWVGGGWWGEWVKGRRKGSRQHLGNCLPDPILTTDEGQWDVSGGWIGQGGGKVD